jgi:hypothetical protein
MQMSTNDWSAVIGAEKSPFENDPFTFMINGNPIQTTTSVAVLLLPVANEEFCVDSLAN